jgi:hypothetical protein
MSVWRITHFDGPDTPHFDIAIIEAPTEVDALDHLEARLASSETVWDPRPREEWFIAPFGGSFVLGGGCR